MEQFTCIETVTTLYLLPSSTTTDGYSDVPSQTITDGSCDLSVNQVTSGYSIPVRITANYGKIANSNDIGQDKMASAMIRGHNKANCIVIDTNHINPSSWLPSLLVTNMCYILNKVEELGTVVELNNPSLVIVTESWLETSIPDLIYNGNCTEWRAIWSEIKRVITKSHDRVAGVRFVITSLISDQNCPTRSAISTLLYSF